MVSLLVPRVFSVPASLGRSLYTKMAEDRGHLKKLASQAIDRISSQLYELNQKIWNNPELSFKEKFAHEELTGFLEHQGFQVTRHHTLETAFRATSGAACKGRNIGVICEYDALPGIGHACGHNLIASAGAGAAVGKSIDPIHKGVSLFLSYTNMCIMNGLNHVKEHL